MASALKLDRTYHVFLSFRGFDTRRNLVSHLYRALDGEGIYTYLDSEELDKGERIDTLLRAIEDSCIALIVFSKKYATSKWCLKELTRAMKCEDAPNGLLVRPMFLDVEPREVKGRDSYKSALDGYETECNNGTAVGFSSEDVKDWRKALEDAAELSGWVYGNSKITVLKDGKPVEQESMETKTEAEFVEDVVQYISEKLQRKPLYVDENTVGMKSQENEVESMLDLKSANEGLMVGLWGMGGLGKSTLAKLIYNSLFKGFQGAAFIEIKSDSIESDYIRSLQQTMLNTLLTRAKLRVTNCHEGIAIMKDRLKTKRILLILDGVEDICQIDNLIGKSKDFLKNGSRIIVTTRNKSLLNKRDAKPYEVKALEYDEACQLLHMCASENREEEISEDLVKRALQCTGRVPSALKQLGSQFRGKDDDGRDRELKKFGSEYNGNIYPQLVNSLDRLKDDTTRDIFLDIACFFNGWNRKYVEGFLGIRHVKCRKDDSYDVVVSIAHDHVKALVDRSLITDDNGTLRVHPLIELMGRKEAGGGNPRNLEKCTRLWCWDDVEKVLSEQVEGGFDVEAIVLASEKPQELENISSVTFRKLKKLRFLIMINVKAKTFPECIDLPSQLRWFEWPGFPASRLKFSRTPWNPAVLAVRKSLLLSNPGAGGGTVT